MKKNILLASVLLLTVSSCSKWNQDPLKDKDGVLQTGKPTLEKPVEQVVETDGVIIDSADLIRFKETEQSEFKISARNFLPGYTIDATVDNLADFPGATFNSTTGEFKWKPAQGLLAINELERMIPLKFVIHATRAGSTPKQKSKQVQILLSRQFTTPKITAIQRLTATLREGESLDVVINIEDADADPMDTKTWSSIQIMPTTWQKNTLSGYMSLKSYRYLNASNYEATFTVDLKDAEISDSADVFYFDMSLISRYNLISDRQTQSITVFTSFSNLISNWTVPLEDKIGRKFSFPFFIADPKGQLDVSFVGLKNEIKNSTTKCISANASTLSCTFTMDASALTVPTVQSFTLTTKSKNKNTADTFEVLKDTVLTINLLK
jgi:hypothetical protein